MASKILLLLSLFKARAPHTSAAVNSWATVCLWRRYLKYEDENGESREIASCTDNTSHCSPNSNNIDTVDQEISCPPDFVRSEWACRELSEFRRSTSYRDYNQRNPHIEEQVQATNPPNQTSTRPNRDRLDLDHPDLRVNGMFLPQ